MVAGLSLLLVAGLLLQLSNVSAALDVPQILVYQGRLTDDDRITVTDTNYSVAFAIYDAASGGNCLWSASDEDADTATIDCTSNTPDGQVTVTTVDGIFTELLGDTTDSHNALPDDLFEENSTLYLGVTIESDSEMSPRRRIGAAAFALQAGNASLLDTLDTDNDGCTSACVPVTDSNGNLVLTGDPQGTGVGQGTLYINPASAGANEIVLGIADNGSALFTVDKEGDATVTANLAVNGNTTLGNAATDTVTLTADVASNILPSADDTYTLGDDSNRWADLYLGPKSLHIGTSGTEGILGYDTGNTMFELDVDGDGTEEVQFDKDGSDRGAIGLYDGSSDYRTIYGDVYGAYGAVSTDSVLEANNGGVFTNGGLSITAGRNTNPLIYTNDTDFTGDYASNADDAGVFHVLQSNATTSVGTYGFMGEKGEITYNGTGANTTGYGTNYIMHANPSATMDAAYGAYAEAEVEAGTVTTAYGVYGLSENAGAGSTITSSFGVYGESTETTGTITTGYGGYFKSDGAATNFAVYTGGGRVHIDDDTSAATPNVATADGSLYVYEDIETDADIDAAGRMALIGTTPSATKVIAFKDTFSTAAGHTGIYGDMEATSAQSHQGITIDLGVNGALNSGGRITGVASQVDVDPDAGSANDAQELSNFTGSTTYNGTGTTDAWYGLNTSIDMAAAGTITNAYGASARLTMTAAGTYGNAYGGLLRVDPGATGTISSNAYGVYADVNASGGGTITGSSYGVYATASDASTQNYAIYTAKGYVHIEGDAAATPPTFGAVGGTGTMFVQDDVEIFDGSLCVGDASGNPANPGGDCANAAAADGVIYSVNTSVTQHDLAEMFPSQEYLLAGEIVAVAEGGDEHVRRAGSTDTIIGAISTAPGLTLGWETEADNHYPVALTGRAPVKVNNENGPIEIGDRITISSTSGVGMKATEAGEIVGIAMQATDFTSGSSDAVITFIQPHFWDGVSLASIAEEEPEPIVDTSSMLTIDDMSIKNIARLEGYNWSVDMEGRFETEGSYEVAIKGLQSQTVLTKSVLSTEHYVTLAGTTKMSGFMADVEFEELDPDFNDIIAPDTPIVVTATMVDGSGSVYVKNKSQDGFELWRNDGEGEYVDWIVIAFRKDYGPEEEGLEEEEEEVAEELVDEVVEDQIDEPVEEEVEEIVDEVIEEAEEPAEEPVEEEVVEEELEDPAIEEEIVEEPAEEAVEDQIDEPAEELVDEPIEVIEELVEEVPAEPEPPEEPIEEVIE